MKVVTAEQMREMDRRAIAQFGIPGVVLMENAGRAVIDVMAREYAPLAGKRISIFCGSGNNGGDGFVIARYLHLAGSRVRVCMVDRADKLKTDARTHYDLARQLPDIVWGDETHHDPSGPPGAPPSAAPFADPFPDAAATAHLIVDALLGTGIKESPKGPYAEAIAAINAAGCPVISVDVPSGLNSDTGAIPGAVVRATHTVTFAYPKLGLFLYPGADCMGCLHVADIGFPWDRLNLPTTCRLIALPRSYRETDGRGGPAGVWTTLGGPFLPTQHPTPDFASAARLLRKRDADANKGDFGHVAIVAGSAGMVGAPAMLARAAQRSGAGLVTVLAPACAQPGIAAKLDEQMTLSLPDADGAISEAAFAAIREFAEKATVLCIGPGLTTKPGAAALVQRLLAEIRRPIVLDADGLNALAQRPDCLRARPDDVRAPLVLTPHPGEAARLLGTSVAQVQSDRIGAVREMARRYRAVVLLKGRYTLIADTTGEVVINTTGNPGMATGGSGDVLTGVIGGLLAQGIAPGKHMTDLTRPDLAGSDLVGSELEGYRAATVRPEDAVALAAYVHGLAGDLAKEQRGEPGLVAGDIVSQLAAALRHLAGQQ